MRRGGGEQLKQVSEFVHPSPPAAKRKIGILLKIWPEDPNLEGCDREETGPRGGVGRCNIYHQIVSILIPSEPLYIAPYVRLYMYVCAIHNKSVPSSKIRHSLRLYIICIFLNTSQILLAHQKFAWICFCMDIFEYIKWTETRGNLFNYNLIKFFFTTSLYLKRFLSRHDPTILSYQNNF